MYTKIAAVILIGIAIIVAGSNPSQEQYIDWISKRAAKQSQSAVASFWLKPAVSSATIRTNLVFCSLYQTDIYNRSTMSLGILGNFILLSPNDI